MTVEPLNERSCLDCGKEFIGSSVLCNECRVAWNRAEAIAAAVARQEAGRRPGRPMRICDMERSAA